MPKHNSAVIFDVDGPLLELTPAEENAFFAPFQSLYGLTGLSNDWDGYRTRNDEEIIAEILENHLGRAPHDHEMTGIAEEYAKVLESGYTDGVLESHQSPALRICSQHYRKTAELLWARQRQICCMQRARGYSRPTCGTMSKAMPVRLMAAVLNLSLIHI